MLGFGGAGFPQVFPVFRVFCTDVLRSGHYQFLHVIIAYPVIAGLVPVIHLSKGKGYRF